MTKINPKILISILNWNNPEDTINTVNSALKLNYSNFKIILIDNASTDNSVAILSRIFPDIPLIITKKNLGYAGGHKIAVKYGLSNDFEALWILNNDILVEKNSLIELVKVYNQNKNAIYGSITLKLDGKTISYGGGAEMIDEQNIDKNSGYNKFANLLYEEIKKYMKTRIISDLNGASIFIPMKIIDKYGFMDTKWFLYGEETDYCHTLRKKYHISSIIIPSSIIVHKGSATIKNNNRLSLVKDYYFTRNINILYKKHFLDYKITGYGSYKHLLKFFTLHFFKNKKKLDDKYWKAYYTKLGQLHSLIGLRGKYIKPEKFV